MKWIEHVVAGLVGGALGSIVIAAIGAEGSLVEVLTIGVLSYATNIPLLLSAILLGWIGGTFAKSGIGALLAGIGAPLIFVALRIAF